MKKNRRSKTAPKGAGSITAEDKRVIRFGLIMAFSAAVLYGLLDYGLRHAAFGQEGNEVTLGHSGLIPPDHPRRLVDFSLINQEGQPVTQRDLKGHYVVVDFIFASCSITCPVVSRRMQEISHLIGNNDDIRLVTLTVDPTDDTVDVMADYGRRYNADPKRWVFLTGDPATMHHLVGQSFLARDDSGDYAYMPGNFAHIERLVLLDPEGHVCGYFDGTQPAAAEAVFHEIKRLKSST